MYNKRFVHATRLISNDLISADTTPFQSICIQTARTSRGEQSLDDIVGLLFIKRNLNDDMSLPKINH